MAMHPAELSLREEKRALRRAMAEQRDALTQAQRDAMTAAPSSAGERMWDVTKDGLAKIPEGFVNSLDPKNILPNVGMGRPVLASSAKKYSSRPPLKTRSLAVESTPESVTSTIS